MDFFLSSSRDPEESIGSCFRANPAIQTLRIWSYIKIYEITPKIIVSLGFKLTVFNYTYIIYTNLYIWSAPLEHDMPGDIFGPFPTLQIARANHVRLLRFQQKIKSEYFIEKFFPQKKFFGRSFFFRVEKSFWKKSLPIFCMLVTRTSGGCHTSPKWQNVLKIVWSTCLSHGFSAF